LEIQEQLFYDSHEHAARYLLDIASDDRRAAGQVYTPAHLADFVLERAGYGELPGRQIATLLDPSCGCGVFLERAVIMLAARFAAAGLDPKSERGRKRFMEAVAESIYGVDVDRQACDLARRALRSAVATSTSSLPPADRFDENIIEADFLLSSRPARLAPAVEGGFGFIVGNPPYVSATRLDDAYKTRLRASLESASGRLDLYTLFIERSLSLLRKGGRLAFITPDKFLVSQSARSLRSVIEREATVRSIARFPSHKVFEDAATVPCVSVIERSRAQAMDGDGVEVMECAERPTEAGDVRVLERWGVPRRSLTASGWRLSPPHLRELEDKIGAGHRTLERVSERISAGLATGRDPLYVIDAEEAGALEDELLRPAIRGRDLAAYRITDPRLRVLIPYSYGEAGRPQLVDIAKYPRAHSHLRPYRHLLEQRHCVRRWRKAWYDLHDPISFDLATRRKVLVPDVAYGSRFAFDEGRYVPLHSVYYIVPRDDIDPHYLTALLNSKPLEFLIRLRAPKVKDGFSRYRKQFLVALPVPGVTTRQATRIAEAAASGETSRVDELVCDAFGLTVGDLERIDRYFGPPPQGVTPARSDDATTAN
jgi:hypothetical protein